MSVIADPQDLLHRMSAKQRKSPMARMMAGLLAHLHRPEVSKVQAVVASPLADELKSAEFDRLASMGSWQDLRDSLRAQDQTRKSAAAGDRAA